MADQKQPDNKPWRPGMVVFEHMMFPEFVMLSHHDPKMRQRAMGACIANKVLQQLTEDRTDESQTVQKPLGDEPQAE